jgi:hypothetical protein
MIEDELSLENDRLKRKGPEPKPGAWCPPLIYAWEIIATEAKNKNNNQAAKVHPIISVSPALHVLLTILFIFIPPLVCLAGGVCFNTCMIRAKKTPDIY